MNPDRWKKKKVDNSSPANSQTHLHTPRALTNTVKDLKTANGKTENNHKTIVGEILRLKISLYRNAPVSGCDFYAPAQFVGTGKDRKTKENFILNKQLKSLMEKYNLTNFMEKFLLSFINSITYFAVLSKNC